MVRFADVSATEIVTGARSRNAVAANKGILRVMPASASLAKSFALPKVAGETVSVFMLKVVASA